MGVLLFKTKSSAIPFNYTFLLVDEFSSLFDTEKSFNHSVGSSNLDVSGQFESLIVIGDRNNRHIVLRVQIFNIFQKIMTFNI